MTTPTARASKLLHEICVLGTARRFDRVLKEIEEAEQRGAARALADVRTETEEDTLDP